MIQSSILASSASSSSAASAQRRQPALEPARARRARAGVDLAVQHLLDLAPERLAELLAGGVVEHLLLDRLGPRDHLGRLAAAARSSREQLVELPPQRVPGIGAHARPASARCRRRSCRAACRPRSPAPTRGSPRGCAPGSAPRCPSPAARGRRTSRSSSCWCRSSDREQRRARRPAPARSAAGAAARSRSRSSRACTSSSRTTAVALRSAPAAWRDHAARVLRLAAATPPRGGSSWAARSLAPEHLGGEEVVLDEVAEASPDPVLPLGDDGGVGDRDVERMAEQRRDGEPVGDAAHHAPPRPWRGRSPARDAAGSSSQAATNTTRHHDEQARGPPLHAVELKLLGLGVGDLRDLAHRPRQRITDRCVRKLHQSS